MRDLEECKAEVFRRSKERIKARKKMKQRTVICCASLGMVLAAGMILPKLGPVDELFGIERDGAVGSVAPEYASVRSTENGSSYQLRYRTSDKEEAIDSYDVLQGFFAGKPETEGTIDTSKETDYVLRGDMITVENTLVYEFSFRIEEGEEAVFRLVGNELTDVKNNRETILTEEQLLTLKTHFRITEE